MMVVEWIAFVLIHAVSAQYYGNYFGRYGSPCAMGCLPTNAGYPSSLGWGSHMYPTFADPYNAANPYAISGAFINPEARGLCVDTNIQCPIWASTGQCATNAIVMRRMCPRSCGTCPLGNVPGLGIEPGIEPGFGYGLGMGGYGGYGGYGGIGLNPLLRRSIYEQGMLRSPTKSTMYPLSAKKDKLIPSNTYSPKTN